MTWPMVKIEDIFEVARGGSPRPIDDFITDDPDGVNWIMIGDTKEGGKYIESTGKKIRLEGVKKSRMVHEGDFLLTNSMSFGRPYILKTSGCIHDGWLVLSPKTEELSTDYFYYYLGSEEVKNKLSLKAAGAVVKNLNKDIVKSLEIPLPPLPEQQRIAAILDKADAIRRKRQQAIQLADDFLRAVFLDMFGSSVEKSRWQEVRFDEVVLIDAKMVDPREDEYLDLLHIGPDRIEKNTGKLLPALTAREENLISKKFLFDHSYVLYSKIRPYLRKVALPDFVGLCSADMYPVRPKDSYLTREFLWQLLLSDDFTNYTETLPGRANIPKLNRNELANYCFKLPPIDLQEKFTAIFKKQNQSYVYSKSAMEMSDSAFGALSQKAFSGEL